MLLLIEQAWNNFYENWKYGDALFFVFMVVIAHHIIWIPVNAFLMYLNYNPYTIFEKWKIQKNKTPSDRLVKECIIKSVISHIFVFPLSVYLILWNAAKFIGMPIAGEFPTFSKILIDFIVMFIVNDALFYWSHRFLHSNPYIYKKFHAQHHRFTTPIGMSSEFASPLESVMANFIPTFLGAYIMKSHLFTLCLWFAFRIQETIEAHSGYNFPFWISQYIPFLHGVRGHDWHHSHNRGVYGMSIFWDWLCGTDKEYREYIKEKA